MTLEQKSFTGNVAVSISEEEVRVWVCDQLGKNIFRFKAHGKVHRGSQDIVVLGETDDISWIPKLLNSLSKKDYIDLVGAVSLITDSLGQELIKKAVEET